MSPTVDSIEADAVDALGEHLLLDVREYDEWMSGHAPGAVHMPMDTVPARVEELPRDRPIVVVCRSGRRSAMVTSWLMTLGYQALNLTGGMHTWAAFGHPLVNHAGNPGVVV